MKGLVQASLIALAVISAPVNAGDKTKLEKANVAIKEATQLKTININTASAEQLQTLKGIGAKKAAAIVKYREKNGKFKSVADLKKIKGIGSKFIAKNKKVLVL
ncbi:helix-hairpin-helix domain-containing protein [Parashewanella curva]|uniref:Helix-hairpin-helix domain-containing protein n=1 Tax=Parashewanella curva TaxID=2338552 RepID=A0A3L8PVG3_9GAMM|nr:ComEA family DNA-binding protein [Parashewanella curva]RLV59321.1 helix-hairpin-helix domain-containing protein [Parashewanella curva]